MSGALEHVMYQNLQDVWENYRTAGVTRLLLARAVERRELPLVIAAFDNALLVICRVRAPLAVMQERVRHRERGIFQNTFVNRVAELDALLDAAAAEDFVVMNDGEQSVTDVAVEMLTRSGWI